MLRELDVELTPEIAEALYIALVTDTGRFQYTNTTPKALRLAAELVEAGRRRPPRLPGHLRVGRVREAQAARRARSSGRRCYEGGRLVVSYLLRERLHRARRGRGVLRGRSSTTCVRSREPTMAALIREPPRRDGAPRRRVSLRASRRRDRRLRDRAALRRRRAPPGGRLLERRARSRRSRSSSTTSSPVPPRALSPSGALPGRQAGGPLVVLGRRRRAAADRRADGARRNARSVRFGAAARVVRCGN